jgi:hypothetical protein
VNDVSILSSLNTGFPNDIHIVYLIFDLSADWTMQFNLKRWVLELRKHFPDKLMRAFANKNDLSKNTSKILSELADLNGLLGSARIPVEPITATKDNQKNK